MKSPKVFFENLTLPQHHMGLRIWEFILHFHGSSSSIINDAFIIRHSHYVLEIQIVLWLGMHMHLSEIAKESVKKLSVTEKVTKTAEMWKLLRSLLIRSCASVCSSCPTTSSATIGEARHLHLHIACFKGELRARLFKNVFAFLFCEHFFELDNFS